ncbi:hypothetical protein [Vibrio phage BONAISHI]|nr:hypothetical protein [Vibrio phage BONAISHI]
MNQLEIQAYNQYQKGTCPCCQQESIFDEFETMDIVMSTCKKCNGSFKVDHVQKKITKGPYNGAA